MAARYKQPTINRFNNQVFHFESLASFANEVALIHKNNKRMKGAKKASFGHDNEYEWDYSTGFEYALEMALDGGKWKRGAEQLQQAQVEAPVIMDIAESEELALERVGACVDIGEYLNNAPECFLHFEPTLHAKPVVKLAAFCSWACSTPATQIFNRGRAILAVIEALEKQGYRVELTGALCMSHDYVTRHNSKLNPGIEIYIKLKDANDTYSAQTLAYALAHPVMFRRLGFRFTEAHNAKITKNFYGYGQPFKLEEYDIAFLHPEYDERFSTPEKALKYAQNLVNTFTRTKKAA